MAGTWADTWNDVRGAMFVMGMAFSIAFSMSEISAYEMTMVDYGHSSLHQEALAVVAEAQSEKLYTKLDCKDAQERVASAGNLFLDALKPGERLMSAN